MSVSTWYVDVGSGNDNNSGCSESVIVQGTAGSTNGTTTVDLSGDSPDLSGVSVGDTIRINGEGNGIRTTDVFEITGVDDGADTVTVNETPGTAAGLTWVIGGAFATLGRAANTVESTGAEVTVNVKSGTSYTETLTLANAAAHDEPIVFMGYGTTPGDKGVFVIDGGSARSYGITTSLGAATNAYWVFENIEIKNHTARGANVGCRHITWRRCWVHHNSGEGLYTGNHQAFDRCDIFDNDGDGITAGLHLFIVGCRIWRNGASGIDSGGSCIVLWSSFFSNNSHHIDAGASNNSSVVVVNCTFDGDDRDSLTAIYVNPSFTGQYVAFNNCIYSNVCGINFDSGRRAINMYNLVNDNTDDYDNGAASTEGEQTGAPEFRNEGGNDYYPRDSSPLVNSGYDGNKTGVAMMAGIGPMPDASDIGCHQTLGVGSMAPRGILTGGRL